jgi:hypothetical protein
MCTLIESSLPFLHLSLSVVVVVQQVNLPVTGLPPKGRQLTSLWIVATQGKRRLTVMSAQTETIEPIRNCFCNCLSLFRPVGTIDFRQVVHGLHMMANDSGRRVATVEPAVVSAWIVLRHLVFSKRTF